MTRSITIEQGYGGGWLVKLGDADISRYIKSIDLHIEDSQPVTVHLVCTAAELTLSPDLEAVVTATQDQQAKQEFLARVIGGAHGR